MWVNKVGEITSSETPTDTQSELRKVNCNFLSTVALTELMF